MLIWAHKPQFLRVSAHLTHNLNYHLVHPGSSPVPDTTHISDQLDTMKEHSANMKSIETPLCFLQIWKYFEVYFKEIAFERNEP